MSAVESYVLARFVRQWRGNESLIAGPAGASLLSAEREQLAAAHAATFTVADLIVALQDAPSSARVRVEGLCLTGTYVVDLASWRGVYADLSLDYSADTGSRTPVVVETLLRDLEAAARGERTFEGYKGGEYVMSPLTPVWVDRYGENAGWRIVGVATPFGEDAVVYVASALADGEAS